MNILVFNCGSSSQSAMLYKVDGRHDPVVAATFKATSVNTITSAEPRLIWQVFDKNGINKAEKITHRQVAKKILKILQENKVPVDAIGHRFVHGGDSFTRTTLLTTDTMRGLRECFPLAPIHNPNSFSVIEACLQTLPAVKQYAVFDTAFHSGLSEAARSYALPGELVKKFSYRKYGFHGLSLQYVSAKTAELLDKPLDQVRLILCHLGTGGSSVTAFAEGHSQDTSMGYSPLAGLVMSTRCGDLDPEIVIDLARRGYSTDEIEKMLNTQSGLIGLSGYSSDLSEVFEHAEGGDVACRVAFDVYANRLKHYLGAYTWQLNGADAIVFTDGIGVSSWQLREAVLSDAENLGVKLDRTANRQANPNSPTWIHEEDSKVKLLVLPTDEERVIYDEVVKNC